MILNSNKDMSQASKRVWLLAGVGLTSGFLMFLLIGFILYSLQGSKKDLNERQQNLIDFVTKIDKFIIESEEYLQLVINDPNTELPFLQLPHDTVAQIRWPKNLSNNQKSYIDDIHEELDTIVEIEKKVHKWKQEQIQKNLELDQVKKTTKSQIKNLVSFITSKKGQQRIEWILLTNGLKNKSKKSLSVKDLKKISQTDYSHIISELSDLSLAIEKFSHESSLDNLANYKDNIFKSSLGRLNREFINLKKVTQSEQTTKLNQTLSNLKKSLFGENFSVDEIYQTIMPSAGGLYTTVSDKIALENQQIELIKVFNTHIEHLSKHRNLLYQHNQTENQNLIANAEEKLIHALLVLLLAGALSIWIFTNLAKHISASIQKQIKTIEESKVSLERSEKKFRTISSSSPIGIFQTSKEGQWIYCNECWQEISGLDEDNSLGIQWQSVIHENDKEDFLETLNTAIVNKTALNTQIRIKNKDQNTKYITINMVGMMSDEQKFIGFIGTIQNITDRVTAEKEKEEIFEQLIQSQKLDSIGKLAGGVAHDFNNILGGILGYANLLKKAVADDENLKSKVDIIEKSALRASELTKQLLGFARKGSCDKKKINLNHCIEESISLLSRSVDKNIEINTKLAKDLWPIEADSTQMIQVLMNLGVNARDAMSDGGTLFFFSENFTASKDFAKTNKDLKEGDYVRISIKDTGTGIPNNIINKIFDPFFTSKDIGKGTGLGLSMVYGILKNHGGAITVETEKDKGTTFCLYLPTPFGQESQGQEPENDMGQHQLTQTI